ncbi:hypothetical protein FGW37_05545 [Streptomyces rectiverticillatus]|nr:hypothetical protein FGW37_05545 [Streptomyces rectiverticillatus]
MRDSSRAWVVDTTHDDKLGEVMEQRGSLIWLRPPGGGREWHCKPSDVRPATKDELAASEVGV